MFLAPIVFIWIGSWKINLGTSMSVRYVRTTEQLADFATKGAVTTTQWKCLMRLFEFRPPTKLCVDDRSRSQSSCAAVAEDPVFAMSHSRAKSAEHDFQSVLWDRIPGEASYKVVQENTDPARGKTVRLDEQEDREDSNLDTFWFEACQDTPDVSRCTVHRSDVEDVIRTYGSSLQSRRTKSRTSLSLKKFRLPKRAVPLGRPRRQLLRDTTC